MDTKPTKGQILKRILEQKNISTKQLAQILDLSTSSAEKYTSSKKDNFDTSVLEKICIALGVSITEFFDEKLINLNQNSFNRNNAINASGSGYSIAGNAINGNTVNVALPETGYKKIINSDGSQTIVEVTSSATPDKRIEELEKRIAEKDYIIKLQNALLQKEGLTF